MDRLAKVLIDGQERISKEEGRPFGDPVDWRELANRCILPDGGHIPESNLLRWKKGEGHPSRFEYVWSLADVFGAEVFDAVGIEITPDLAFFFKHRADPKVQAVLNQARRAAERRELQGESQQAA
jgi:hypothetical protein